MYLELVYSSRASDTIDRSDILSIQRNSIKCNAGKDITGFLLNFNQHFVGILEGEEEETRKLFHRIKDDSKHSKVELLASEFAKERHFESWNMVFQIASRKGDITMADRLFRDNLISLTHLIEKPTYTTEVFWREIRKLLEQK